MKKLSLLFAICFFTFLSGYSQTGQNKTTSQKVVRKGEKGDEYVEKELLQKQLALPPQRLGEQPVKDEEPGEKVSNTPKKKVKKAHINKVKKS